MVKLKELRFDWDLWNVQKNEVKHGVSALEAEGAFYDETAPVFEDLRHSTARERRYILYGKSGEGRVLMVGFTVRRGKIRIITARPASQEERRVYGEAEGS